MRLREERGSAAILVALMLTAFCGFTALGIDIGRGYAAFEHLNGAAAAAALAGAADLPFDPAGAASTAVAYAVDNGVSSSDVTTSVSPDNDILTVTVTGSVSWTFARVLGFDSSQVAGQAAAAAGAVTRVVGAMPWGVQQQSFVPGQSYTLMSTTSQVGNFGGLALGGTGAANYQQNIEAGYDSPLNVGDTVSLMSETGEMAGPTRTGVDYVLGEDPGSTWTDFSVDSPRFLRVPVVTPYGNGHSQVTIIGFATFFLQGQDKSGNVIGIYVTTPVGGPWCQLDSPGCTDTGAHVVKLIG